MLLNSLLISSISFSHRIKAQALLETITAYCAYTCMSLTNSHQAIVIITNELKIMEEKLKNKQLAKPSQPC